MNQEQRQAYEWAKSQNYQSVAARYAKILAGLIDEMNPPNEPLTLEQLREMDGEPAYIPETNCWVLVTKNPFVPLFTWPDGEQCSAYDWYEQVGPVYRRPPEGEEDT